MNLYLGVDPGLDGALAILTEDGRLMRVHDMPTLEDGPKGRRTIAAPLLATLIAKAGVVRAIVEKVATRPGEGAVGAFAFGRGVGVLHGIFAAFDIPVVLITPQAWRKHHNLSKEAKDASRSKAIALWPDKAELFALKKWDGRAEACLLTLAGLRVAA